MIIWISGPTGAGKTTLTAILQSFGYATVEERLSQDRLNAFTSDPVRHCASLQEEIMRSRLDGWQKLTNASRVVFDRSVDEDLNVFCRMHFESGFLTDQQFRNLKDLAGKLTMLLPMPDLILFMCPRPKTLARRVTLQTHPEFIVHNLERQRALYSEWLETRSEDVLTLDNSDCKLETIQRLLRENLLC
jgi:deoxyadenosine/deoxycytidine kinase